MKEIWKYLKINGFEIHISNLGNLKKNEKSLSNNSLDKDGYVVNKLYSKEKNLNVKRHRLVALAFLENPNDYSTVNHKNGIKNDNRVDNLEWANRSQQEKHAFKLGLKNSQGENHSQARLTEFQVIEIFHLATSGKITNRIIAKKFNIHETYVCNIKYKRKWKHILKDL